MDLSPSTFVKIEGTQISVEAHGAAEAKLALKELKLNKKELGIQKRVIASRQKEVRSSYTDEVRTRGSMMRGGGGFGRLVRAFQTVSRDSKRAGLANELAPLERAKQDIEAMIHAIDTLIIKVEAELLRASEA
jgi:hypothetical protein